MIPEASPLSDSREERKTQPGQLIVKKANYVTSAESHERRLAASRSPQRGIPPSLSSATSAKILHPFQRQGPALGQSQQIGVKLDQNHQYKTTGP